MLTTVPHHGLLDGRFPWPQPMIQGFNAIMAERDERVDDLKLWLMSPSACGIIVTGYLLLIGVLVIFMKLRGKPFVLKTPMLIHNLLMTVLSLYMVIEFLRQAFVVGDYSVWGNTLDRSEKGLGMVRIVHIHYLSKIPEFLDTVFMVLRCKFRQISFLHIYHHSSIFVVWWIVTSISPGGDAYFGATVNSFIHVLLYGYYLWSAAAKKINYKALNRKPRWTEPAFYRKYITTAQLTQFTVILCQAIYLFFYWEQEGHQRMCNQLLFFYQLTMLALFGNFFMRQYVATGGTNSKTAPAKNDTQEYVLKKRS